MERTKLFKDVLRGKKITACRAAEIVGKSVATINLYKSGAAYPPDEVMVLLQAVECEPEKVTRKTREEILARGEQVKKAMAARGYKLKDAAEVTGRSVSLIQNYTSGVAYAPDEIIAALESFSGLTSRQRRLVAARIIAHLVSSVVLIPDIVAATGWTRETVMGYYRKELDVTDAVIETLSGIAARRTKYYDYERLQSQALGLYKAPVYSPPPPATDIFRRDALERNISECEMTIGTAAGFLGLSEPELMAMLRGEKTIDRAWFDRASDHMEGYSRAYFDRLFAEGSDRRHEKGAEFFLLYNRLWLRLGSADAIPGAIGTTAEKLAPYLAGEKIASPAALARMREVVGSGAPGGCMPGENV